MNLDPQNLKQVKEDWDECLAGTYGTGRDFLVALFQTEIRKYAEEFQEYRKLTPEEEDILEQYG